MTVAEDFCSAHIPLPRSYVLKQILIKLEYKGTNFSGWQIQPNANTIQETVQKAFEIITRQTVLTKAVSRTDTGVHANEQFATLFVPEVQDLKKLFKSVNSLLPDDIAVIDLVEVPAEYNLRNEVVRKRYVYQVLNSPIQRVFEKETWLLIKSPIEIPLISDSIQQFIGQHDFSAYRGKGCQQPSPLKTITHTDVFVEKSNDYLKLKIIIEGSGFLKNMVRIMVGTLLDIAQKRLEPGALMKSLKTGKREDAGKTAASHGLFLDRIILNTNPFENRDAKGRNS